jgi:vacuolar-type H+-ATPase subunit F/Vma7
MQRIAVVGERLLVEGYLLAGALGVVAETPEEAVESVASLPGDVGVVLLTPAAAAALNGNAHLLRDRLTAVMPA